MGRRAAAVFLMLSLTACSAGSQSRTTLAGPTPSGVVAPSCEGQFVLLRLDKIKKGGTIEGVEKAAQDHLAWYRNNGFKDNDVVAARVLKYDPASNSYVNDDSLIVTLHVNPPAETATQTDHKEMSQESTAAWHAYVREYDANSDILATVPVCLPDKL